MVMAEKKAVFEDKVPFGDQIEAFMSNDSKVLWKLVREREVEFPKFTFYVGKQIIEKCGEEILLKFLERNELKDRGLAQRLENEARSRIESRGGGKV